MTSVKGKSIGDRMKEYENVTRDFLYRRTPVIIRLDGKAFHTFTRKFQKPYDQRLCDVMHAVTTFLLDEVQGAEIGYTQSDEISVVLRDYSRFESEAWFDNNIQKIVSVAASMATAVFAMKASAIPSWPSDSMAFFDARVFNLPKEEVINYLIWRQQDATRNSIQALGQANFSHTQMHGLSTNKVVEELQKIGIDWNDCPDFYKYGQTLLRDGSVMPHSLFKESRDFLNDIIYIKESE